jgi:inorganic pyrophosphatase
VPFRDPSFSNIHDVHDIAPAFRDEIEHFFQRYKELEEKKTETNGFGNRREAEQIVIAARERAAR